MAIKTWSANNSRAWRSSGWRTDSRRPYQGNYGYGNHAGFIWFNVSDIQSTLSGQIIDKVEVYLRRISENHGYSAAVPAHVWNHNVTDGGSVSTSSFINKNASAASFTKGEGKWFTVSNSIGEALKNGSSKGIVLWTTDTAYSQYAIFDAYNETYKPQIRITYHVANTAPTTPGSFTSPSATRYESSISVAWGASTDADGDIITYQLEVSISGGTYSRIYSGTSRSYSHSITGISRGTSIRYRVRAYDGKAYSGYRYSSTCYRNAAPSTPGSFTYPSSGVTIKRESKTIAWGASTDDQTAQANLQYEVGLSTDGGSSYKIIRSFATGVSFSYNFTNVSTNANFNSSNCYLRVRTRDQHNIGSGYRTSGKFIIDFREPPTMPGVFSGVISKPEKEQLTISWGASTDPNGDSITYLLQFWNRSAWITLVSALTGTSYIHTLPSVSANFSDYKYRVRATDATGLSSNYRESATFSIAQNSVPTVVTGKYSNRTMATANVAGTITNLGGHDVLEHGHCWGTSSNPTIANSKTTLGAKVTTGSFSSALEGLDENTTYYVRAYATNIVGTSYGAQITVPKYYPPLYIDPHGIGIGKKWEQGVLDVGGDVYVDGDVVARGNSFLSHLIDYETHLAESANKHIAESGSNNDGYWLKYDDGTMICYGIKEFTSKEVNLNIGQLARSELIRINFPQIFLGRPSISRDLHNALQCFFGAELISADKFGGYILSPTSKILGYFVIVWQAIGRWK